MPTDLDALTTQLDDKKASRRVQAAKKLSKAMTADRTLATPTVLTALAAHTRDRSDAVGAAAANALVSAGPAAVEPLIAMLQLDRLPGSAAEVTDDDSIAHSNICGALGRIPDPRCVPALQAIAASLSRGNIGALVGLGELAKGDGDAAASAIEALQALAQEGGSADVTVPAIAQSVLAEIDGVEKDAQQAMASGEVDVPDELGRTALHRASAAFSLDAVAELLAAGANPDAADVNGFTPLIAVVDTASRHTKIPAEARACLDALITAGADVNARTNAGRSTLFFVTDHKMAKALLAAGAAVDVVDAEGWTPLHGVVQRGSVPIARLLLEAGADADAANAKGRTPRQCLSTNRKKMETLLLEFGGTP